MALFSCTESRPGYLTLFGEITISDAIELKELFCERLRTCLSLEVDLLNVTKIDTSGVQLMVALQRAARECGKSISWMGYSAAVEDVIILLNLGASIGNPSAVIWS